MKLLPRTLFGRILVALFCGLLAVQAIGVWLMLDERARLGERLFGEYAAQRVAGIVTILDLADAQERTRLVRLLSAPPLRFTLDEPWQAQAENSEEAAAFSARVTRELEEPVAFQVVSIRRVERPQRPERTGEGAARERAGDARGREREDDAAAGAGDDRRPDRGERAWGRGGRGGQILMLVAKAMLEDGVVVTFRRVRPEPSLDWPLRALGLLAALGLFVAILAGWAVRLVTRPLASLADAASGLARDLDRPPLPESGPQEVARAAQAFNAMQRDLRRILETRAQALAGVSHDLRMPLTRMRLRLEQLPEGELRSKFEDDIAEMDAMIASTLEFLRAGSGAEKPVRLNLNALLEGVAEDVHALGARVNIEGKVAAPIVAQPQAMRRCLANLLDNALRYGGADIDLRVKDAGDRVEIRVQDRGPGIPVADRERVFEPYVRLEASRAKHTGGTGLGLAIARAIAVVHGGDIRMEAREGGGLAAVLSLPRRAEEAPSAAESVSVPIHEQP